MKKKRSPFSTYNTLRDPAAQNVYDEFARRLQARMQQLGMNQSELARRCTKLLPKPEKGQKQNLDFGRDRISRYIRAITLPRPESLPTLAKALELEQSDLLPPLSVPGGGDRPVFEIRQIGDDRVSLHINRTTKLSTALKISALLQEEDAG